MDDIQAVHKSTPSVTKIKLEKPKSIETLMMTEHFIETKFKI